MKIKRLLIGLLAIFLIIFTTGSLYYFYITKKSLPSHSEVVLSNKLSGKVTLTRDSWGIPHITASSDNDLYFAFGYAMAQDRLWQMDLLRTIASGRLTEIFPKHAKLITIDTIFKSLAIKENALEKEQLWLKNDSQAPYLKNLKQFIAGINHFILLNKDKLPVEFKILNYEPEPFTIADSIMISGYMAVGLNPTLKAEMLFGKLVTKYGLKKTMKLFPEQRDQGYITIPSYHPEKQAITYRHSLLQKNFSPFFLTDYSAGSNAWVIAPDKSESGTSVLANDPHLLFQNPSIWYEAHLISYQINIYGFFLPLVPFAMIGRNSQIAWGMTAILLDDCDYYIETIRKEKSKYYYLYMQEWKEINKIIPINIQNENGTIQKSQIIYTHHGPLISRLFPGVNKDISIKWAYYDLDNNSFKAFYRVNQSKNWYDLNQAVKHHKSPGMNIIYTDTSGNIGYIAAGSIPIRAKNGDGILPMDGTSGKQEWQGYVPFLKQPKQYNPPEQYIISANNKIVDNSYPHYISRYWEPSDRADRIAELIQQKAKLSIDDHQQIQGDVFLKSGQNLLPIMLRAVESAESLSQIETELISELKQWDYYQSINSVAATIYNKWIFEILKYILKKKLNQEDFETYLESRFADKLLPTLLLQEKSFWYDNPDTPHKIESRTDVIIESFHNGVKYLTEKLGKKLSEWKWGNRHQVEFTHPIGKIKLVSHLFNVGPFAIGGNRQSVNKAHYMYDQTTKVIAGPPMRVIFNMNSLANTHLINTPGQSGHHNDRNYRNQAKLWIENQYRKPTIPDQSRNSLNNNKLIFMPQQKTD